MRILWSSHMSSQSDNRLNRQLNHPISKCTVKLNKGSLNQHQPNSLRWMRSSLNLRIRLIVLHHSTKSLTNKTITIIITRIMKITINTIRIIIQTNKTTINNMISSMIIRSIMSNHKSPYLISKMFQQKCIKTLLQMKFKFPRLQRT